MSKSGQQVIHKWVKALLICMTTLGIDHLDAEQHLGALKKLWRARNFI